jgi:hypothetical protein
MSMNQYDVEDAMDWFDEEEQPMLHRGAVILYRLMRWTNSRSDGWCYWVKPSKAAAQLMTLLQDAHREYRRTWERTDITRPELAKALTPIKSLITREGGDWRLVFDPPPPPDPFRPIKAAAWEEGMAAAKLAAAGIKPAQNPYLDG